MLKLKSFETNTQAWCERRRGQCTSAKPALEKQSTRSSTSWTSWTFSRLITGALRFACLSIRTPWSGREGKESKCIVGRNTDSKTKCAVWLSANKSQQSVKHSTEKDPIRYFDFLATGNYHGSASSTTSAHSCSTRPYMMSSSHPLIFKVISPP